MRTWSLKARDEATGARSMRFLRSAPPPLSPGAPGRAELAALAVLLDLDRQREAARAVAPRAIRKLGPAKAATRREQGQRLEEIGLAGAVLAA